MEQWDAEDLLIGDHCSKLQDYDICRAKDQLAAESSPLWSSHVTAALRMP